MSEWVEKPLGEMAAFVMGQSPDSATVTTEERGLPFLQGCAEFGAVCPEAVVRVDPPLKIAPKGSTLISVRAPVGTMNQADQDYGIGRGLAAIVGADHSRSFLQAAVQQNVGWLHRRSQGSTFLAIGSDDLKNLPILVPHNPKIAEKAAQVLDLIDTQIEATEALIAKQERLRAGLMQDLFTRGVDENGELRPPREEAPHLYHETELGWLPNGWEDGSILRYCTNERQPILTGPFGADLGSEDFVEDGVPLLRIGNVQDRYLKLDELLYVSERKALQLSKYRIVPSDLLFARQGATTGRNALASDDVDGALINYHIIRVSLDTRKCDPRFIESMFNSWLISHQIEQSKGRGTREGINTQQIVSLKFPGPELEEQRRLTLLLNSLINEITELKVELGKLRRQKTGLMQDLLTGKVSVEPLLEKGPA